MVSRVQRRTAWRHWWTAAAAIGSGLVAVIATRTVADLDLWVLVPVGAGWITMIISLVVNRPRPFAQPGGWAVGDRERRAAIKAVRRGIGVEPPPLQRYTVETLRRE